MGVYEKIAALKKELIPLAKDKENPFHKSAYFDINGILEHVEPLMTKHGLLLMQPIIDGYVVSIIMDLETKEVDKSSLKLPESPDPQKIGSCITYYRRYTVQSQLGLQAEDDDANKASGKGDNQSQQNADNRPWLNQTQFNSALERIKKKEAGVYEKIDKAFRINKAYRTQLKAA